MNNPVFVASSWSDLYLLIKDARSFEHDVTNYRMKFHYHE